MTTVPNGQPCRIPFHRSRQAARPSRSTRPGGLRMHLGSPTTTARPFEILFCLSPVATSRALHDPAVPATHGGKPAIVLEPAGSRSSGGLPPWGFFGDPQSADGGKRNSGLLNWATRVLSRWLSLVTSAMNRQGTGDGGGERARQRKGSASAELALTR